MEKSIILANVPNLTAEQLFNEIQQGNVTLRELIDTGNLPFAVRRKIEEYDRVEKAKIQAQIDAKDNEAWEIARNGSETQLGDYITTFPAGKHVQDAKSLLASKDDEAWERARYGNEVQLGEYIAKFPAGKHVQAAKSRIQYLEQEHIRIQVEKDKVLLNVKNNPNTYDPLQIKGFLQNGTITKEELQACDIPEEVIKAILESNLAPPKLELGAMPDSIPSGYTEVYFWGIPGSGKTCALAALLHTAYNAGYLRIAAGPGYDYMTKVRNIFSDNLAVLPSPTPVKTWQYLPFTLRRRKEGHSRSVSLIELSGEIFQCFYCINAGKSMPTGDHQKTFEKLKQFLSDDNRKIHFFFIDYDRQNRTDDFGYLQSDYLDAAALYFSKSENNVFGKSTDAIYVVLTKSDLMRDNDGNKVPAKKRVEYAKQHLAGKGFASFVEALRDNCIEHGINAGKLTIEPFSLGEVYFQRICRFDDSSAQDIVKILIDRIDPKRTSFLDRILIR
jgi:hypothetical protein